MTTRELLDARVRARLVGAQSDWFATAIARAAAGPEAQLLQIYTDASRRLGDGPLAPADGAGADDPFAAWTLEDAGRLVCLLARHAAAGDPDRFAAEATACFEQGDTREQGSWLRGVAWLPEPERYLPLVIDACRTNILPIFEAVACGNPYPARYFPERNFNQVVLKALFNGVALARIHDLAARANPELARMANDYAAERRAAGRTVPADIDLATSGAAAPRTTT